MLTPMDRALGLRRRDWLAGTPCGSIIDNRIELPGVEQFDAKSAKIRQFLRGELDQGRTRELMEEMRTAGLPT
jgi:hypothetical protein